MWIDLVYIGMGEIYISKYLGLIFNELWKSGGICVSKKWGLFFIGLLLAANNFVSAAEVVIDKDADNNIIFENEGNVLESDPSNRVRDNLVLGQNNLISKTEPDAVASDNVIVGSGNQLDGMYGTIVGNDNLVDHNPGSVVIGDGNKLLAPVSGGLGVDNVVIGRGNTVANSSSSVIIGDQASVDGYRSIAMGDKATVTGNMAIALGDEATASSTGAIATGAYSQASGQQSIATGTYANASGKHSIATGSSSIATGEKSIAFGAGAVASNDSDVALGSLSETSAVVNTQGTTIRGQYYQFAGTNAQSTVSIGRAGDERTLTNVAAGRISADSTDGINGSQLYATNQAVENLEANTGQLSNRINNLSGEVKSVGALSAALSALKPIQYDPNNKSQMMAGVGSYRGEQAVAIGLGYYFNEANFAHIGGSFDFGGGSPMWNAGFTFKFGGDKRRKNANPTYGAEPITSVQILQRENVELRGKMDHLEKENDNLKQRLEALESVLFLKNK